MFKKANKIVGEFIKENNIKGAKVIFYYIIGILGYYAGFIVSLSKAVITNYRINKVAKRIRKERIIKIELPDYLLDRIADEVDEEIKTYVFRLINTKEKLSDSNIDKIINDVINRNIY